MFRIGTLIWRHHWVINASSGITYIKLANNITYSKFAFYDLLLGTLQFLLWFYFLSADWKVHLISVLFTIIPILLY